MSRSRRLLPAGFTRLIRHSTTIDPYLDESGDSARRLGSLALDGAAFDAIDLSPALALSAEIRAAARSTLRIPCAAIGPARARATFTATVASEDGTEKQRRVQISGNGYGRWHVIVMRVPPGPLTLTLRVAADGDPPGIGAVCGVPSMSWRKSPRAVARAIASALRTLGIGGTLRRVRTQIDVDPAAQYEEWRRCRALTPERLAEARAADAALAVRPRFLLLLETPAGSGELSLDATRASLDMQVYSDWEVRPADDAEARNAALGQTDADFVGVIRAGDRLSPVALLRVAQRLASDPAADVVYSDEDVWPLDGVPARPRFKPGWSPELLQACMYLGRLFVVRRTLALDAGGYRARMDGALDYDLALRACPAARAVAHVPDVLYHRGAPAAGQPDSAAPAAAAALADACARGGLDARVVPGAAAGVWRARIAVAEPPRVAIVIPTDGQGGEDGAPALVAQLVRALRERTRYPHYDLLVCDNGNLSADTRAFLETVPHRRATYSWEGAFNFPRKINFAVRQTDAPYVLLLNDDVEPINADWLDAMLEYAHQPQVGAVGAKLFYPDGRLQHVGVAVGVCGVAAHLLHQHPGGSQGCGGIAVTVRNCTAVTGACLLARRRVYDEVGGFDDALAVDFNDVDFCLRVGHAGYRVVFTPHARLFHHESASFGARRQRAEEVAAMWERWGPVLEHDPYYNVNLSREFPDCRIRPCR